MMPFVINENETEHFFYSLKSLVSNQSPGMHKSHAIGPGNDFYRVVPFSRHHDAKRIDLRATLRDPYKELYVRQFRQRSRISVNVIVDCSSSMNFSTRLYEIERFIKSSLLSASKVKDKFNCFLCHEKITHMHANDVTSLNLKEHLNLDFLERQDASESLSKVYQRLPARDTLVFFVSDFHFNDHFLSTVFHSLKKHRLIPVVSWAVREQKYPKWGIAKLEDAEKRESKTIILTPKKREAYQEKWRNRRRNLEHVFSQFGLSGFFINGCFNPRKMTEYFFAQ